MIMSQSAQSDIYRPIIEQIADAIIYSDSEGIIRVWNAAAMEIFGYTKDEAIGQSLDLIIPERLRAAHWAGFNRAMERGMTQHAGRATVTRSLTRDGGSVFVEMSFAVVTDGDGKAMGSVAMARDVTKRHRAEQLLRRRTVTPTHEQ
jgi:PAS domain S-box-containing protein